MLSRKKKCYLDFTAYDILGVVSTHITFVFLLYQLSFNFFVGIALSPVSMKY